MRRLIAILASAVLMTAAFGAARKKSPSSRKTTAKKTQASARKKSTSKKGTSKKRGRKSASAPAQTWRSRQLSPTPDRYREIQQALVEKGYLKGEPTGKWDETSSDALRRFQQEQNIEPTGKINSLSLIALGLGPKHDTASAAPAPSPARP